MNRLGLILITWLALIAMIATNALANILPINQLNTGQISAFYPNFFVPAGFTFSIWGVIYLLLLNYVISFSLYTFNYKKFPAVNSYLSIVNKWFIATCFLNATWILAWHYLWIWTSVLIMLLFLGVLIYLYMEGKKEISFLSKPQQFLLFTPFVVYLGWISVATVANITALLVKIDWGGFGLSPEYWSGVMILIATILAVLSLIKERVFSYSIVIMWALWGIEAARTKDSSSLSQLAFICLLVVLVAFLWESIVRKFIHTNT